LSSGQSDDPFLAALREGLSGPGPYGLAVSGGGDSTALMHLCAGAGIAAEVATVDHGLRVEAAEEARMVAAQALALGFRHETLVWDGPAAKGNLPDAARLARRSLLSAWAKARGLQAVVLAHTQDDVAETFLMRLARGAGVDGLSAMVPAFQAEGCQFLRPLLSTGRQALRDWLTARTIPWAEDPTNHDPHYDRTRARSALQLLGPLGLTPARLAEVAGHLSEARGALEAGADALLRRAVTQEGSGLALRIDAGTLFAAPADLQRRALVAILQWFAPAPYAPRGDQVGALLGRLQGGKPGQLRGVRFFQHKAQLWSCLEPEAPMRRWQIEGPEVGSLTLRALGPDGLPQCPDWRASGLPRAALLTAPSLWDQGRLISAPHARLPAGFRAQLSQVRPLATGPNISH